jgi:eukaryotic-like serine/threonine-protein kinase
MRYQRLLPLGSGGMANVHLALALGQGGFKRLVVVKSVREELHADPGMRQMFLAEARISARLNHPNVVQVSEVVETAEGVMLVMEYLDGLPLSGAYRNAHEKLTLAMRLRILCDVLAGLHYAHDLADYHGRPLGIVHRDVSPQNVFLTFDGRVKLLDFGIAKVNAAPDRTRTGVIKGRIAYMPLEQVTSKAVDRRTDVYAVGCLLWEAAASRRMWGTLTEPQIVRELLKGNIPRLDSQVDADPELERIVTRATAQQPADRYQSAEDLRLELEHYLAALGPVSPREIGELLAAVCSDARAERQRELAEAVSTAERELASLVDLESTRQTRTRSLGAGAQVSGIASRPRSLRSFSPTPGPYLFPATSTSSSAPPASERSRSSSISVQLRPRRRGWLIALGLAGALAAGAWLPTLLRAPAASVASAVPAPPSAVVPARTEPMAEPSASSEPEAAESAPSAASTAKHARGRVRVAAPAAVSIPAVRPKPQGNCDPPYFFSAGIKTYKPECI